MYTASELQSIMDHTQPAASVVSRRLPEFVAAAAMLLYGAEILPEYATAVKLGAMFLVLVAIVTRESAPGHAPSTKVEAPSSDITAALDPAAFPGILAAGIYVPACCVGQAELAAAQGNVQASGATSLSHGGAGAYSATAAACVGVHGDCEDDTSLALSALASLLEGHAIRPHEVGRLDVASDGPCGIDRAVLAEHLMSIDSENEGETTTTNDIRSIPEGGCVSGASEGGGWAAVIAALHWIESPHWDGKFAIVVVANDGSNSSSVADAWNNGQGNSRSQGNGSTGGSGAVALLLGRDAPLVVDLSSRTLRSRVDTVGSPGGGKDSSSLGGEAAFAALAAGLERCYTAFANNGGSKMMARGPRGGSAGGGGVASSTNGKVASSSFSPVGCSLNAFDFCVLPSAPPQGAPLVSPVSGGLARTVLAKWLLQDARRQPGSSTSARKLSALAAASPRENDGTSGGGDEKWHASLRALTRAEYTDKAALSVGLGREVGLGGAAAALGDLLCLLAVSDQHEEGDDGPHQGASSRLPPPSSSSSGGAAIDGPHFFEGRSALIGSLGPQAVQILSVYGRRPLRGDQKNGDADGGAMSSTTAGVTAGAGALPSPRARFTLAKLRSVLDLSSRLRARRRCPPFELASASRASQALARCASSQAPPISWDESGAHAAPSNSWIAAPQLASAAASSAGGSNNSSSHGGTHGASAEEVLHFSWPLARLPPGAFYLASVKGPAPQLHSRAYARKTMDSIVDLEAPLGPTVEEQLRRAAAAAVAAKKEAADVVAASGATVISETNTDPTTTTRDEQQWNQNVEIVVTGTAAGLPSPRVPANAINSGHSTDSSGSSSSSGDSSSSSSGGVVFARNAFDALNLHRLVYGENCIDALTPKELSAMVDKNVVMLEKRKDGTIAKHVQATPEDCIKLGAMLPPVDLTSAYGVSASLAATMDSAAKAAVAAGLEALKDAGLVPGGSPDPKAWQLPEHLKDRTAVLFAASYPGLDATVAEVMRYAESQAPKGASVGKLVRELRRRLEACKAAPTVRGSKPLPVHSRGPLSGLTSEEETALRTLEEVCLKATANNPLPFEFDRKFLFKVLCLGNAQLAQVCGARGPNAQTNAACAGTTQAVAMAQDLLRAGRCDRVIVVAADNASSPALMPWLGNGFRALGAASTASAVCDAALPFNPRRSGMLVGAGAVGLVLETAPSLAQRLGRSLPTPSSFPSPTPNSPLQPSLGSSLARKLPVGNSGSSPVGKFADGTAIANSADASAVSSPSGASGAATTTASGGPAKCRMLATQYSNSAYHGAALDRKHIARELTRFLAHLESEHGVSKAMLAAKGVYLSHETCTHASPASSCAANEVGALRDAFGDELLSQLVLLNTKGYTGHAMGASFEDVAACEVLFHQRVPPNPNGSLADPYLGNVRLSSGGPMEVDYALRFSAGFGSQVCFALYTRLSP